MLAQLSLLSSLVVLRFEEKGKHSFFLADVTVKTWNPEAVGPTTTTSGWKAAFRDSVSQKPMTSELNACLGSRPDFKAPVTHRSHSAPYTPDSIYLKLKALASENVLDP